MRDRRDPILQDRDALSEAVVTVHFFLELLDPLICQPGRGQDPAEGACQRSGQRQQRDENVLFHVAVYLLSPIPRSR